MPLVCAGTRLIAQPERSSKSQHAAVAGCSMLDVTILDRPLPKATAPRIARLLASVAPPVKTISSGAASMRVATLARAFSMASRARLPSG